ncbi:dynamin family protein [Neobacillus vireti]|uniref:HSR1-like GTP-binding protein n=1 Tax=Neobacillus vireti LMG 21834 TaxID=1131730 RepID=A0AB94IUZ2_9BACI|nr:dynamin family protein [Neobacillus vireti]ETI70885.1 HSR1-like GTP-binding protein [Neobacillus vireti LMG 21834]KLT17585.1 GTP-binding protein [Neobacillus vireti]
MSIEKQLKQKTYHEMFINEHENSHPIRVLGEAFQEEAEKDLPDLSQIRFAQGEVYFHYKDFEAAIFKWENISNDLEPWAKKNTADAYYELGMLSTAEDIYTAIVTDNPTLNTEVALQLFSLYIDRDKLDAAVSVMKKTINANPDYPNVTEIARTFFEEQQDWNNAIELAVNEAKRTESPVWFDMVITYVEKGVTKSLAPSYFSQALILLFGLDKEKFEQLVSALWNSYKNEETYLSWLSEINHLLLNLDLDRNENWPGLSMLHKETYFSFIDGRYFIKKIQEFIPDLLTNWLRLADQANVVLASAAVLSWNELFPASISTTIVSEAENLISMTETDMDELDECLTLFDSIMNWAEDHEMGKNHRLKWLVDQLIDFDTQHIFITGLSGSGKSSFVNTILGEDLQDSPTSSVVMFKNDEELAITEITDWEITNLAGFSDFQERMDRRRNALESIIEFKLPNAFLQGNRVAFIDTPGLKGSLHERNEILKSLHVADNVLFVVDANVPFTEKERSVLTQIQEVAPDIPIHFIISKMDTITGEQEVIRIFEETRSTIQTYLPESQVFAFSSQYEGGSQLKDLKEFIQSINNSINIEDKRLAKLLFYIRTTIASLLQKRIDVENQLLESVRWNEEMLMKLTGAVNQLKDTEAQKAKAFTKSYRAFKDAIEIDIAETVPSLLKECSVLIKEDSNFSKIHLELNDEMNRRLQAYLEEQVMPKYYRLLQDWIVRCKEEFEEGQEFLNEMAESFNQMYGDERLKLECDFKVLDDWRRDMDRMTSRFQLDSINILLRRTPSQFLLKSAGKLFGAISQNKAMLYNKYKSFVENEDYAEAAKLVCDQFFRPFELFEKSLERDVTMFFKSPLTMLNRSVEEASAGIQTNQEMLNNMNANPEMFRDPLTLFEVRLRQFEWMTVAGKGMQTIY